jgi:hypothetical protein
MTGFKKGQRVKVEFEAVVVERNKAFTRVIPDDSPGRNGVTVPTNSLVPLSPPGWPPQVGDIWAAGGKEWFARHDEYRFHETAMPVVLVPEDGEWTTPDSLKTLNPVLKRRRDQ